MAKLAKELWGLEKEFYEVDDQKMIAYVKLHFAKPSDIFEYAAITKIPLVTDDFMEWLLGSFSYVPDKYKVDISAYFDDFEGYSEEELHHILKKNTEHVAKVQFRESRMFNYLALSLCGVGFVFVGISLLVAYLWKEGGNIRDIVAFLLDILATVPFWAAADIFFVENGAVRKKTRNLMRRFHGFHIRHYSELVEAEESKVTK